MSPLLLAVMVSVAFPLSRRERGSGGEADTVPPYLAFPETGLDDPAAYEGYQTRVYQDASGNGFQVYLKSSGRVVNLWADAANESVGFSVRDSTGKPAELRSEEHTSELQSQSNLVCRLLLEKK